MENNFKGHQMATREQLKSLHSIACNEWKEVIVDLLKQNIWANDIEVPQRHIAKAFDQAKENQKDGIKEVFNLDFMKPQFAEKWEGLASIDGYYVTNESKIGIHNAGGATDINRNVFATEKQALSALAAAQLSQLMKQVNGDWVPDWNGVRSNDIIQRRGSSLVRWSATNAYCFLAFKDHIIRNQFLKNHEQLIKQYYEL